VGHSGELSFFMLLSAAKPADEDIVAILSYLRSLPPVDKAVPAGEWYLFGKVLLTYAFAPMQPAESTGPPSSRRGRSRASSGGATWRSPSRCARVVTPSSTRPPSGRLDRKPEAACPIRATAVTRTWSSSRRTSRRIPRA
jgi:hypothetical protein